jgi:hypothetical protein
MGRFSSRRRSKASVFAINLVILGNPALVLRQAPRTSLYSTSRAHIILQSTTVNAATNPCRIGSNSCARNGFQPHFHAHKRFSPSTASKHSTNSLYKEKQACTTTSTPFSDYQIMPTFPLPIVSSSCPLCFSQVLISIVPLSRDSSCIQDVEEFDVPQTSWSRSRPSRNWWDIQGELMVECPACPHPGRNLPDDWEKAGPLL